VYYYAIWTPKLHAAKVHPSGLTANGVVPVIQLPPELLLLAQIGTKSFVGWGFAPDHSGGAYSSPPDPLAGLECRLRFNHFVWHCARYKSFFCRGWGPWGKGRREGTGKRLGGEGREGKGVQGVPECPNPELASLVLPVRQFAVRSSLIHVHVARLAKIAAVPRNVWNYIHSPVVGYGPPVFAKYT